MRASEVAPKSRIQDILLTDNSSLAKVKQTHETINCKNKVRFVVALP